MNKKKLLVSFSGGQTSAYMTKWCIDNLSNQYEIVVVFANTGKEREETLQFINECDKHFNFNTVWVEAVVAPEKGKGTSFQIVTFETASRNGEPFERVIQKYGIPNSAFPHCTRELKTRPIHKYIKSLGWKRYYTAIGIRKDEVDRIDKNYKKNRFVYPFIALNMKPSDKIDVNIFWLTQDFRLKLKGYEGNCDLCWKKSDRKILTLLLENPNRAEWWDEMQKKYGKGQYHFFRKNRSILDLLKQSESPFNVARDDSKDTVKFTSLELFDDLDLTNGCEESCEPFAVNY